MFASVAWRVLAIAVVLYLAMGQAWILRADLAALQARSVQPAHLDIWFSLREGLTPVCGLLALIGVALGMGAGTIFSRPNPPRRRPYWLFVPLAAAVAILFVGLPGGWWGAITQLILIALEAVSNAMRPPAPGLPGSLSSRMLRAGVETIPAAVACLGLALVVARDFELTRRGQPWATSRRGWAIRVAWLVAAAASAAVVAFIAIPTVHPHWFGGIRMVLEPRIVVLVLAAFGLFSAGLAARTLEPPPAAERPPWLGWFMRSATMAVLAIVLLTALNHLPAAAQMEPGLPPIVARAYDLIGRLNVWLWSWLPDAFAIEAANWLQPDRQTWAFAMAIVTLLVLELSLHRGARERPAPFDAVAESPGRLSRFLWLTAALTTLCIAALPTLTVLGQVIIHMHFMHDHWSRYGWPSPF
jgi:hypothetical protein